MSESQKPSTQESERKTPRSIPVRRKIGEPPGNLRKREEWFKKRSGNS
jgi:hypothetical protein